MHGVAFLGADLSGATVLFPNLIGANLAYATLRNATIQAYMGRA